MGVFAQCMFSCWEVRFGLTLPPISQAVWLYTCCLISLWLLFSVLKQMDDSSPTSLGHWGCWWWISWQSSCLPEIQQRPWHVWGSGPVPSWPAGFMYIQLPKNSLYIVFLWKTIRSSFKILVSKSSLFFQVL